MSDEDFELDQYQNEASQSRRRDVLKGIGIVSTGLLGLTGTAFASSETGLTASEEKRARKLIKRAENAKNPDQIAAQMSKEDRDLIKKAIKVREVSIDQSVGSTSSVTTEEGEVSISSVCDTITTTLTGSSYLGDQWAYIVETDFCFNGSSVTNADWRRYAEVYGVYWHFDGHIGLDENGQVGTDYYQVWTQGEFHSSGGGFEFDHAYPWIEQTFYGDGTWNGDGNHGECSNC